MKKELKFKNGHKEIIFYPIDGFGETQVFTLDSNDVCVNFLNPDQINQLITHLSTQLQSIGVQVDILKEK
jgi:spore maturation protein CgeB